MAVEVQTGAPLYPNMAYEQFGADPLIAQWIKSPESVSRETHISSISTMLPHFLHDLESVFWIVAHTLLTTLPHSAPQYLDLSPQHTPIGKLFPQNLEGSSARRNFLRCAAKEYIEYFDMLPMPHKAIAGYLWSVKAELLRRYDASTKKGSDYAHSPEFQEIYQILLDFCDRACTVASEHIFNLP